MLCYEILPSLILRSDSIGKKLKQIWYDVNRTLTHNALFNLIIGNRSSGKSYSLKKKAISEFKKTGRQFIYLRRYKSELDESKEVYFNDVLVEFPDDEITFESDCYFINGMLCGYAMALTKAKDFKSTAYPNVWLIIYEEFIIEETGFTHYLKNEVSLFLNFYMSIDRYRGVKVFFLGNNFTMFNPYTIYWKINMPYNSNIVKAQNGKILLEMVNNEEFIQDRLETDFGQLIAGTKFADFAVMNKSPIDNDIFIMKKTPKCSYYFTFKYQGELFGVWVDYSEGKFFVSNDVDSYFKIIYCITLDDHTPNSLLLKSVNKSVYFKTFIDNYKGGNVYFESMRIKSVVYNVIRLCLGGS